MGLRQKETQAKRLSTAVASAVRTIRSSGDQRLAQTNAVRIIRADYGPIKAKKVASKLLNMANSELGRNPQINTPSVEEMDAVGRLRATNIIDKLSQISGGAALLTYASFVLQLIPKEAGMQDFWAFTALGVAMGVGMIATYRIERSVDKVLGRPVEGFEPNLQDLQ